MAATPSNIPTKGWYKGEEKAIMQANVKMYGRSKRANLMFASELHHRYGSSSGITIVAAHPGFTHTDICKNGCKGKHFGKGLQNSEFLVGNIKMSAEDGALSQSYAAVVPEPAVYVGPKWVLVGPPVILGGISSSWHHYPFTRDESKVLWDQSMAALRIEEFGAYDETGPGEEPTNEDGPASIG